jgi:hypothetical protein
MSNDINTKVAIATPHELTRAGRLEQARAMAATGASLSEIANALAVEPRTVNRWIAEDPALVEAMAVGAALRDQRVEMALYDKALGEGNCDVAAAKFWLSNRAPQRWKEKTEAAAAAVGIIINIKFRDEWGSLGKEIE